MSTSQINNIIKQTEEDFYHSEWSYKDFLTEDDVRCRLFMSLHEALESFPEASVHSEIRWYGRSLNDNDEELRYRSDIVIIDRNDLEVNSTDTFDLPSKGFGFDKFYAIIEIKLRRPNEQTSLAKFNKKVDEDVEKLRTIRDRTYPIDHRKLFYTIAFDKKGKRKKMIELTNGINTEDNWVTT